MHSLLKWIRVLLIVTLIVGLVLLFIADEAKIDPETHAFVRDTNGELVRSNPELYKQASTIAIVAGAGLAPYVLYMVWKKIMKRKQHKLMEEDELEDEFQRIV